MIIDTESYNEKRYGRPYIAQCDELGKVVKWGEWIGSDGYEGELHIDLSHDCIVMRGQKDNRGNNSSPKFATFINGTLSEWTLNKIKVVREFRNHCAMVCTTTKKRVE